MKKTIAEIIKIIFFLAFFVACLLLSYHWFRWIGVIVYAIGVVIGCAHETHKQSKQQSMPTPATPNEPPKQNEQYTMEMFDEMPKYEDIKEKMEG